jgi:molybdenum cofactor biosynthesis enzyme
MSDLTRRSNEPARLADLRSRAAARLKGPAAAKGTAAAAADALGVLHALASSPETAADALAMLHELQVHQVELELQAQELRESRAELEAALRRQLEL